MDMQEKDLQRNQQDQLRNEQTGGASRSSDSTYSNTDAVRNQNGQTSIQGSFQDGTLRQPSQTDTQKYGERATTSGVQRIDQNDNKW